MKLTHDDILHLADLSKLSLREEEIEYAKADLTSILSYVERLSAVNTEGVEQYTAPPRDQFRKDVFLSCTDDIRKRIIQNFPAKQGDALKTPGVFVSPKK